MPHDQLAAQIVRQATLGKVAGAPPTEGEEFAIVFAAIGVKNDVADYFRRSFTESGALTRLAMFLNLADDPPVERIVTSRAALTLAEHLAYERDMHVLVVLTDMTNYGEALRQISNVRGEVPSRKGYPGYLYSDLASLYERTGRIRTSKGSITQIPILTMPNDDITHPMPDLTGYITEGQIVLGRELNFAGLRLRGVMGVALPQIEARGEPPKLPYSPGHTTAALDEASDAFREVLLRVPQLSMLTAAVWRLANELQKTQRRVNALQHIFIPQYKPQIEFIVSSLEEREREETFRLKWLKTKMTKATAEIVVK